jgi:hypothetical protein
LIIREHLNYHLGSCQNLKGGVQMLQGEQAPPEAILTLDGNVVNRLFEFLKHDADRELGRRFLCHLKEVQVFSYETLRAQLCCPSCNSPHFVRKGWRRRVVKSTRGRLEAVVLQARCKLCGRTFRPLNTRIGLSTGRRFLDEMLESALKLSLQLSYGRSSAIMRKLTGGQICGETLHVSQIRTGEALHLREGAWEVASQTIDHLRPPTLSPQSTKFNPPTMIWWRAPAASIRDLFGITRYYHLRLAT